MILDILIFISLILKFLMEWELVTPVPCIATGCIALLLSHGDNNAKLSWRDVKELVSISCDNTADPTSYADINTSIKNVWVYQPVLVENITSITVLVYSIVRN